MSLFDPLSRAGSVSDLVHRRHRRSKVGRHRGGTATLLSARRPVRGKTLAAFLICLDRLVRAARAGTLEDSTQVIYISPLKALSNDIHRNLELPLAEIAGWAKREGIALLPIRTAVRTGDTPASRTCAHAQKAAAYSCYNAGILFILLTAEKSRADSANCSTVIVDEIHAMADDKRGSHLALSLARLDALTGSSSATYRPLRHR